MTKPCIDLVIPEPEVVEGEEAISRPESPVERDVAIALYEAERASILAGQKIGLETLIRLVGFALGIDKNIEIIKQRKQDIDAVSTEIEEAEKKGEPIEELEKKKESVDYREPLHPPQRGFVLMGFPESAEQLQALQAGLKLDLERVIVLKKGPAGEDGE